MNNTEYKKLRATFRYWVLGKAENSPEYYKVLKAMNIAEEYHKGKRKGGDPEMSHQYSICCYLRTLHKYFKNPVLVFIVALLHDTYEDYYKEDPSLLDKIKELIGEDYIYVIRISKVRDGNNIPYPEYFGEMQECEICSIVKLADRIHNVSTMVGTFSYEKQTQYLQDLDNWFFPMLKYAKRKFPEQEPAYENMKSVLFMQKSLILSVREDVSVPQICSKESC